MHREDSYQRAFRINGPHAEIGPRCPCGMELLGAGCLFCGDASGRVGPLLRQVLAPEPTRESIRAEDAERLEKARAGAIAALSQQLTAAGIAECSTSATDAESDSPSLTASTTAASKAARGTRTSAAPQSSTRRRTSPPMETRCVENVLSKAGLHQCVNRKKPGTDYCGIHRQTVTAGSMTDFPTALLDEADSLPFA